MFGGGQENGVRPGTENVAQIVGCAAAFDYVSEPREEETLRLKDLQDYFISQIEKEIPTSKLNGSRTERAPHIVNICIPGINAEFTVLQLDSKGICCSFMTSCKTLNDDSASYVVAALTKEDCSRSSLRFSMGKVTTKKDIDTTIDELKKVIPLSHI
jgi:cysteine desulfurase